MNNQKITYQLGAIFLSFLMLFSTIGFSMDIHFCGGHVDNFAFYGQADECSMMKKGTSEETPSCHQKVEKKCHSHSDKNAISKKNCCENESYVLQTIEDGQTSNSFEIANFDLTIVTVFILSNFNLFEFETKRAEYFNYSPPILNDDVTILHQLFLI